MLLRAMVEERRVVCWRDVLQLMYTPGLPEVGVVQGSKKEQGFHLRKFL